jgi:wyosine [tRNA(Phe)-imidazoG37] synthetase (radical SAM superfamily)
MMVTEGHGLTETIVYGPVRSRRYGRALGVNVLPMGRKTCGLDCVYCQLGHLRVESSAAEFPSPAAVGAALRASSREPIDAIVVSGNGEPTLHPAFGEVVEEIRAARDAAYPGTPLVCLTSGTEIYRPSIATALRRLDETAVKLDAGGCVMLRRAALPSVPYCVETLVSRIRPLGAVVQTCFFDGPLTNAGADDVRAWIGALREAEPVRVDVYTVSRTPPSPRIGPLPASRLHEIASLASRETGVPTWVAV